MAMATPESRRDRGAPAVEADETAPLLGDASSAASQSTVADRSSELWLLCEYSVPLIATYFLQYSFTVITTLVAGHLSSDDLAATSIGLTTVNIIGLATFEGMATALDTLCSQAYGSGNLHGVGLHVQRMLVLMTLAIIPIGAVWICSPWILPLFVKQEHLAVMAGSFLRVSLIGLPGYASFEALKRFLQAQGDCNAALIVLIICTPVNAFLSWLFTFKLEMGLEGAALGAALSNNLRPILLVLYIAFFAKWSHQCWGGLSREAFTNWGPMVRLSAAGSIVNLGEWFAFEILTFSTSYVSIDDLAAQTILNTLSVTAWHIPFSISVAISIRVGHLIGAGLVDAARRAASIYAAVFTVVGIFDAAVMFLLRNELPKIFTEESHVRELCAQAMITVSVFQIIDSINSGTNGMLRGLGRQSVAGWIIFPVQYLFAVPLAAWLELGSPDLKLNGLWLGLAAGLTATALIECIYMKVTKWQDCVESAKSREE
ncbi:mate-domain-containing protein [Pestalotiopsis sp. NC0098]|nr:mate-domain-containing protein [Pestalotiopsis sp. NC0098]